MEHRKSVRVKFESHRLVRELAVLREGKWSRLVPRRGRLSAKIVSLDRLRDERNLSFRCKGKHGRYEALVEFPVLGGGWLSR